MRILSLFDGISCGRVALKRVGLNVSEYFASEIDSCAISIAQKNFPDTIQVGDIQNIQGASLPKIDLMIGGSPCQSFSRAGDNSGFHGKSGLFFEYVRLLKECAPRYFLLENVVMKKEWEKKISQILQRDPIYINSSLVSAQKRERAYWTNIPINKQPKDREVFLEDILVQTEEDCSLSENEKTLLLGVQGGKLRVKNATKRGFLEAEHGDSVNVAVPSSKTRRGRVGKKKTNTLDTNRTHCVFLNGEIRKLNIIEHERLQTLPDNYTAGASLSQRYKAIGNGWTVDVIAHIFRGLFNG